MRSSGWSHLEVLHSCPIPSGPQPGSFSSTRSRSNAARGQPSRPSGGYRRPGEDTEDRDPIRHLGDTLNAVDLPELLVLDAGEWRRWLSTHHADSLGVWLVLAKKGTADPTTILYDEALDEAICFGWIDGQLKRRDTLLSDDGSRLEEFAARGLNGTLPSQKD